jgi:hypothetical protein
MKPRSLVAMAVAGTFVWSAGALANGSQRSVEVQTPASVSESAPWLTGQPHLAGSSAQASTRMSSLAHQQLSDSSTASGASSGMSAYGSGGYDSTDSTLSSASDRPMIGRVKHVEYWLLGDQSADRSERSIMSMSGASYDTARSTGSLDSALSGDPSLGTGNSSGAGGSGSVAFDSRTPLSSGQYTYDSVRQPTPGVTEHYLVLGGLDTFDPSNALVFETGSRPERFALLEHLSHDFYVLTPIGPASDV